MWHLNMSFNAFQLHRSCRFRRRYKPTITKEWLNTEIFTNWTPRWDWSIFLDLTWKIFWTYKTYIKHVIKKLFILTFIKTWNNGKCIGNLKFTSKLYIYSVNIVVYQGPNQTNQDSIQAWLKHEEPNSTRQQQEVINQTPSPSEYSLQQDKGSGWNSLGHKTVKSS